jgi:hypothetical protein
MALSEQRLRDDLKVAMRAKDAMRLRVLRSVLAAIKNKAIERKPTPLGEADLVAVVTREAKQCRETLDSARNAGREETVAEHECMLAILESYLPRQLSDEELQSVVAEIVAKTGATSIGPVMKELSARYGGQFDGKKASAAAARLLAGG